METVLLKKGSNHNQQNYCKSLCNHGMLLQPVMEPADAHLGSHVAKLSHVTASGEAGNHQNFEFACTLNVTFI